MEPLFKSGATRRNFVAGAATSLVLPAIAQSPTELSVGLVNSSSDVTIFIAQKKGWFKDENILVKTVEFKGATDMVAPLGAGQLDVGGGSMSAGLYNAFARGIKLKAVADKSSSQPGYAVNKMIVAKRHFDSGRYREMKDLKGFKIGNTGLGNSGWGSVQAVLKAAGLTFKDVELVDLAYPNHVAAMQNNSIDASLATEPTATLLVRSGTGIEIAADDKMAPRHAIAQILFSERMTRDRALAVRFMRAYLRAARYYFGALKDSRLAGPNAEEIISILTESTAIKDPEIYRSITPNGIDPNGRIDMKSLGDDRNLYRENGWMESDVKLEDVVDMSFVEEAIKSVGLYVAP